MGISEEEISLSRIDRPPVWQNKYGFVQNSRDRWLDTILLFFPELFQYTMNIFELKLHTFTATNDYLLKRNIKDI